ncbi:MAG TPA: transglycosylase SLT domain-containing protein [Pyrinomonadaceae bacterium]|nr:transglycosylase SLT domain-containing protein [Pyrinomonadaceae bacterium]
MALLAQQALACAAGLLLALSCARVAAPRPAAEAPPPQFYSEEAPALSAEDQGQDALAATRRADGGPRDSGEELPRLTPQEHMRRAAVYQANRAFDEAREHWRTLIERFPSDENVPAAHFGIGRTLFQEKRYEEALPVFRRLGETYIETPAGRDGFYYVAATLLRMDRPGEAAARYAEYAERFPEGERIENAYLNIIDSLREAGRPEESLPWIERTRARFRGTATDANALFARLRLDISRGDWQSALRSVEELSRVSLTRAVNTNASELAYLRAFSLEKSGQKQQAARAYEGIADGIGSYFGGLATARLSKMGGAAKSSALAREGRVRAEAKRSAAEYPAPYRDALVRAAREQKIDPRLMLAIMRQESGFKAQAKSGAGARGLMQMTPDVGAKYAALLKLTLQSEDDLYRPEINIRLAAAYIGELERMFPALPEAVAASYNGGEDSVARWVRRAVHDDPGIFTAEVGFTETKDYVHKVMANYRAYKLLYTEDLKPR